MNSEIPTLIHDIIIKIFVSPQTNTYSCLEYLLLLAKYIQISQYKISTTEEKKMRETKKQKRWNLTNKRNKKTLVALLLEGNTEYTLNHLFFLLNEPFFNSI